MRLLVTGATGFVGRELLRRLPEGVDAIGIARTLPDWAESVPGLDWIETDLTRSRFQRDLPGDVDAVIHLAQSRFDRSFPDGIDDVAEVNVAATARLLDYARQAGTKRFVLASTATVYRHSPDPLAEDAPLELSSFYAASKRAAELLVEAYASELPATILRLFTTYGAGQKGRVLADLLERVRTGTAVTVQGNRGLLLSPIHVEDVVAVLLAACTEPGPRCETLNVGGPDAIGLAEVARRMGAAVGREPVFEQVAGGEPGGLVADTTRMRARFPGLTPVTFADGIRRTVASVPAS